MKESFGLVVVGAGPAGMMCAYQAAQSGMSVVVIDPNRSAGRKLRITGKGRCNITNSCDIKTFLTNVPGGGKFLYSALNRFSPADTIRFFEDNGLRLKTERGRRVFPESDRADDVADLIFSLCNGAGVKFVRDKVSELCISDSVISGVIMQSGKAIESDNVCVCTGGLSYPLTGSTGDGYEFAKAAGHTVIPARPSLVALESDDAYCAEMQGLTLKNVTLRLFENEKCIYEELGELLFTHFGVSGPLILSASALIRKMHDVSYRFEIDLKPALDEAALDRRILSDFSKYSNRTFSNSLNDLLPSGMVPVMVTLSGIDPDIRVNSISREDRKKLLSLFKAFPVSISGFRSIDEAIVTAGGVSLKEVNPRTMESKLVKGLFFAGEVLDLDAFTGGYNLQIAWSTGFVAGQSVYFKG